LRVGGLSISLPKTPATSVTAARPLTPEAVLAESAANASIIASRMERRINTHLILGLFIGLVGLGVWFLSFNFPPSFEPESYEKLLREMLPRLTILIFIELLAGFFLRQYRIGVEDFKYFLDVQRRLAGRHVAFLLVQSLNDQAATKTFVDALLSQQSDTRLAANETTTTLEAAKSEQNITMAALESLGKQLEVIVKGLKRG
jgi:hypothetical protein